MPSTLSSDMYPYTKAMTMARILPGTAIRTPEGHECVVEAVRDTNISVSRKVYSSTEQWVERDIDPATMDICAYRIVGASRARVVYNLKAEPEEHRVMFIGTETGRFRTMVVDGCLMIRGPRVSVSGNSATTDWVRAYDGDSLVVGTYEVGTFVFNEEVTATSASSTDIAVDAMLSMSIMARERQVADREARVSEREAIVSQREAALRLISSTITNVLNASKKRRLVV